MKVWYKYILSKEKPLQQFTAEDRQDYMEYSIPYPQSIAATKKMSPLTRAFVNYLEDFFSNRTKGLQVISLGCAEAEHELKYLHKYPEEKPNWTFADYDKRSQEHLWQVDPELITRQIDILADNIAEDLINKFDVVFIPGLIVYFTDQELKQCLRNISRIAKKEGHLLLSLRSLDSKQLNFIRFFLAPLDAKLLQIARRILKGEKNTVNKIKHGYVRSFKEVEKLAEKVGFKLDHVKSTCFGYDFDCRFGIFNKLKFKKVFGKNAPYLNIMRFKKD